MDRATILTEEHDSILRKLSETTGFPLSHWFALLDKTGGPRQGFLAALAFLRDRMDVPHHHASAIAYSYLNRSLVPTELKEPGPIVTWSEDEDEWEEASEEEAAPAPAVTRAKSATPAAPARPAEKAKKSEKKARAAKKEKKAKAGKKAGSKKKGKAKGKKAGKKAGRTR
jgi:hypothetical protein